MHIAALVITRSIGLKTGLHSLVVNYDMLRTSKRVHHYLQQIQQLTRVTAGIAEKRLSFIDLDILML